jgi:hypothetical protein
MSFFKDLAQVQTPADARHQVLRHRPRAELAPAGLHRQVPLSPEEPPVVAHSAPVHLRATRTSLKRI